MARTIMLTREQQGRLTRRTMLGAGTAALGSALLASPASAVTATNPGGPGVPTPRGFDKFLVYIAEG